MIVDSGSLPIQKERKKGGKEKRTRDKKKRKWGRGRGVVCLKEKGKFHS